MTSMRATSMCGAWAAAVASMASCGGPNEEVGGKMPTVQAAPSAVRLSPGEITGVITTQMGSEVNRCLHDPVGAVLSLRQRGDIMGFNGPPGGFGTDYPKLNNEPWHWQGIQRLPPIYNGPVDFDRAQSRFMIVSSSQEPFDAGHQTITGPHFAVVHMGSRNDDGLRWRGNRMALGSPDWHNAPHAPDLLVQNHSVEHLEAGVDYNHASSIQVLGSYLFQPLESYDGGLPETECVHDIGNDCQARVNVYDLRTLQDASPAATGPQLNFITRVEDVGASAVAAARISPLPGETESRVLMIVAGGVGASRNLELWLTDPADPTTHAALDTTTNPFLRKLTLDLYHEVLPGAGVYRQEWSDYQNIALVTGCEPAGGEGTGGQLFLLGMTRTGANDDVVDIFELNFTLVNGKFEANILHDGKEGPIARRHMYCDQADFQDENQCDFDAGAGAYVDPAGRLFIYATDFVHDGPGGSVPMMEFRPEDHLDDPATAVIEGCPTLTDSWVELYDNPLYKSDGAQPDGPLPAVETGGPDADDCCKGTTHGGYPSSRVGMMIDWEERHARSYGKYSTAYDWTADKGATDAARWCVPYGYKYVAFFDTDFRGSKGFVELWGDDTLHGMNFLEEHPLSSGCFMTAGTAIDPSGASNAPSCL